MNEAAGGEAAGGDPAADAGSRSRGSARDDPEAELLRALAEELAAGGIDGEVLDADGEIPAQLLIPVGRPQDGVTVAVGFVPGLRNPPVLQYVAALDLDVPPDRVGDLARLTQIVNSNLPLTGFELSEALGAVVFRSVQPLSVHPLDPAVVAWPLSMMDFALSAYGGLLRDVATGVQLEEVVEGFARIQSALLADDG